MLWNIINDFYFGNCTFIRINFVIESIKNVMRIKILFQKEFHKI